MGINIANLVDIKTENNRELIMRVKTDVQNGDTFYTDLNGFQVRPSKLITCKVIETNIHGFRLETWKLFVF